MAPPADLDALSAAELKARILQLLGRVAELERTAAAQREEIARLKGLKGRPQLNPQLKPSGMEKASEPKPSRAPDKRRGCGKVVPRVAVEDWVIKATVPPGSRFKGHEDFSDRSCAASPSPSIIRGRSPCRASWRSCARSGSRSPSGRPCAG